MGVSDNNEHLDAVLALRKAASANDCKTIHKLLTIPNLLKLDETTGIDADRTALQLAASFGHTNALEQLLAAGADVNHWRSPANLPALFHAIKSRYSFAMDILINAGAQLYVETADGTWRLDAVTCAICFNYWKGVEKLLWKGIGEEACSTCMDCGVNNSGVVPALYYACVHSHPKLVGILLDEDSDGNGVNRVVVECGGFNTTPLMAAVENDNMEVVELLLRRGASVSRPMARADGQPGDPFPAVHTAAALGHFDILRVLLRCCNTSAEVVDAALRGVLGRFSRRGADGGEEFVNRFVDEFVPPDHHRLTSSSPHLILYYALHDWAEFDKLVDLVNAEKGAHEHRNLVRAFEAAVRDAWWMAVESLLALVPLAQANLVPLLYPHIQGPGTTTEDAQGDEGVLLRCRRRFLIPQDVLARLVLACPKQLQEVFRMCISKQNFQGGQQLLEAGLLLTEEDMVALHRDLLDGVQHFVESGSIMGTPRGGQGNSRSYVAPKDGNATRQQDGTGDTTATRPPDKEGKKAKVQGDNDGTKGNEIPMDDKKDDESPPGNEGDKRDKLQGRGNFKRKRGRHTEGTSPTTSKPSAAGLSSPKPTKGRSAKAKGGDHGQSKQERSTKQGGGGSSLLPFATIPHVETKRKKLRKATDIQEAYMFEEMLPELPDQQFHWLLARIRCQMFQEELSQQFAHKPELLVLKSPQSGNTWLYSAMEMGSARVDPSWIRTAASLGLDINEQNEEHATLLHQATRRPETGKLVPVILELGANVDAQDDRGWTPLMWTLGHRAGWGLAEKLINAGADVSHRDFEGKSVLDIAKANNMSGGPCLRLLEGKDNPPPRPRPPPQPQQPKSKRPKWRLPQPNVQSKRPS